MIPIYNLIKNNDNYKCLWQYYRDEPALDNNTITNFPGNSVSFKYKVKITGKTLTDGNTKDVKIAVPLKNNYWNTFNYLWNLSYFNLATKL